MMMDPVGITDIAKRANVRPDTVKKWIDRHPNFPKHEAEVGGRRAWEWGKVDHWLRMSGRLPTHFRYTDRNGHLEVQVPDGDRRWRSIATFTNSTDPDNDTSWVARPTKLAIEQMDGDRAEAQAWADRLLAGWDKKRAEWVRDHPDEPMPAHLVGGFVDIEPEPEQATEAPPPTDDEQSTGDDERDPLRRAKARLTARWALGQIDDQTYQDALDELDEVANDEPTP